MKKWIVGILATTALLTGCGVGVDDPEGMAAAMGSSFALEVNGVIQLEPQPGPSAPNTTSSNSLNAVQSASSQFGNGGGTVSAPQDPIPFFDPNLGKNAGYPTASQPTR